MNKHNCQCAECGHASDTLFCSPNCRTTWTRIFKSGEVPPNKGPMAEWELIEHLGLHSIPLPWEASKSASRDVEIPKRKKAATGPTSIVGADFETGIAESFPANVLRFGNGWFYLGDVPVARDTGIGKQLVRNRLKQYGLNRLEIAKAIREAKQ